MVVDDHENTKLLSASVPASQLDDINSMDVYDSETEKTLVQSKSLEATCECAGVIFID